MRERLGLSPFEPSASAVTDMLQTSNPATTSKATPEEIAAANAAAREALAAPQARAKTRKQVAEYDYTDANGALLYQVVRYQAEGLRAAPT